MRSRSSRKKGFNCTQTRLKVEHACFVDTIGRGGRTNDTGARGGSRNLWDLAIHYREISVDELGLPRKVLYLYFSGTSCVLYTELNWMSSALFLGKETNFHWLRYFFRQSEINYFNLKLFLILFFPFPFFLLFCKWHVNTTYLGNYLLK